MKGTSLAQYRIEDELGRGGMGIVYRATDTKLDRTVALKVLPAAALASDEDRARFYREAKAAAALNHPHIAAIYQIDEAVPVAADGSEVNASDGPRPFIAMEFIPGDTLQERIRSGPLKLADAIRLASEMADALTAAHAKGIVHRDIKSANIMLTADGKAKVLDFGLAQTSASTKLTRMGSTLGTVAYMSPEQARGEEVDGRSDMYSLGTVLYEMVTGRLPFGGEYEQAVVYGILNEHPEPLTALRTGVPMELERITLKLLAKDAADRYQSGADLMVDLKHVHVGSGHVSTAHASLHSASRPALSAAPMSGNRSSAASGWRPALGGLVFGIVLVAVVAWLMWPAAPVRRPANVSVPLGSVGNLSFPELSPSGEWLAFKGSSGDKVGIYLRNMATGTLRYVEGSAASGDRQLTFSPDGVHLAFTDGFNNGVMVVVIPAGLPRRVTDFGRIAFWTSPTEFVMTDDKPGGGDLYRGFLDGSPPVRIEVPDPKLPDGFGNVAYSVIPGSSRAFGHQLQRAEGGGFSGSAKIFTIDLDTGELDIIEENALNPTFVAGGWLLYQIGGDAGASVVRPVDVRTGRFTGQPQDVYLDGLTVEWSMYTVSASGDLLFIEHESTSGTAGRRVLWLANVESGNITRLSDFLDTVDEGGAFYPVFSPDEQSILYGVATGDRSDVHATTVHGDPPIQYTFNGLFGYGSFSPDGQTLYMMGFSGQGEDSLITIHRMPTDRSTPPRPLEEDAAFPIATPDGRELVLARGFLTSNARLDRYDLADGTNTNIESGLPEIGYPDVSPDGRFVAFQSPLRAISTSVFIRSMDGIQSFRLPGTTNQMPRWSADGKWLFLFQDGMIVRYPVRTQPTFNVLGAAEVLLSTGNAAGFDVSRDGSSIVVAARTVRWRNIDSAPATLVWLQNWTSTLERQ
ncbi:MAG: protein kinase [Rhodothermales bacterium]